MPELPGCTAHGQTYEEALMDAQVSMPLRIGTAKEFGDSIPTPGDIRSHCPADPDFPTSHGLDSHKRNTKSLYRSFLHSNNSVDAGLSNAPVKSKVSPTLLAYGLAMLIVNDDCFVNCLRNAKAAVPSKAKSAP